MSSERPHADHLPGGADPLLQESVRRALLRTLCHQMQISFDPKQVRGLGLREWDRTQLIAEMIGDLVGLEGERVFEFFGDADFTCDGLVEQLEPLLARDCGSWMTKACF
jgi:hypothetical protein